MKQTELPRSRGKQRPLLYPSHNKPNIFCHYDLLRIDLCKTVSMHVLIYSSFNNVVLGALMRSTSPSAQPILLHEARSRLSAPYALTGNEHHVAAGYSLPVKVLSSVSRSAGQIVIVG